MNPNNLIQPVLLLVSHNGIIMDVLPILATMSNLSISILPMALVSIQLEVSILVTDIRFQ